MAFALAHLSVLVGDGEYSDVAFSPSQSWLIGAPEEDVKLFYQCTSFFSL